MLFLLKILRLFIIIEKIQYIKLRNREKKLIRCFKVFNNFKRQDNHHILILK
jgi:hypothetical protein